MGTVFLSYRQESEAHKQSVRAFALRLREAGVQVVLDALQNEEVWDKGGPNEGWLTWSYAQVEVNDKILIIGTPSYYAVYEGKAAPNVGIGAAIEARSIFLLLAQAKGINTRFRVVTLAPGDDGGIPLHLRDYQRYAPNERESDFADLVTWLLAEKPLSPAPPSAAAVNFPPTTIRVERDGFLNCTEAFATFERMLTVGNNTRILLVEADGEHGKSTLLTRLYRHSRTLLGVTAAARVELKKPGPTPDDHLRTFARALGLSSPAGHNLDQRTHDLLDNLEGRPTVLFFDAYEHVEHTESYWVNLFLEKALDAPWLRCVVAGRQVPLRDPQPWGAYAHLVHCDALRDTDAFIAYAKERGSSLPADHIAGLCDAFRRMRERFRRAGRTDHGVSPKALIEEIHQSCSGGGMA